ncbi:MAG: hypothetical protein ABIR57_05900, partial [Aeromicrobium sp.]
MTDDSARDAGSADEPWATDVRALFTRGKALSPQDCPGLGALISRWLLPETSIQRRHLEGFVRAVLWHADRRESRPQTGEQWEDLSVRRSFREAILGYLFLPRLDQTSGLPTRVSDEDKVRDDDPRVLPYKQKHRQRWAALRQLALQGKEYEPSSLHAYGRRGARADYPNQLIEDIVAIIGNEEELADLLFDFVPLEEIGVAWHQQLYRPAAER